MARHAPIQDFRYRRLSRFAFPFLFALLLFVPLAFPLLRSRALDGQAKEADDEERQRIQSAIEDVKDIRIRMGEATPHDIARGIFAFGKDLRIYEKQGDTFVPAVEYLLNEATYKGRRIFAEKKGQVFVVSPGKERGKVQDLPDEILMILGLTGVGLDEKIRISPKKEVTVKDLLETAKKRVNPGAELSCTMVALAVYLPWGEEWEGRKKGKMLSVEKLLKASFRKNPVAYLDDGAHHLFALSYLMRRWQKEGGMPKALEKALSDRLAQRRVRIRAQQAGDGGLGFLGVKSLETSALHLNWIVISGPWEDVEQPWVHRASLRLAEDLRKGIKRGRAPYGLFALAARALSKYSSLKYPGPG